MKYVVIILIAVFWPLELILHNQNQAYELITYIAPAILIYFAFKYYECNRVYSYLAIILVAILATKLTLLPILFFLIEIVFNRHPRPALPAGRFNSEPEASKQELKILKRFQNDKWQVLFLGLSLLLIFINWNSFYGQTIFVPDYEAEQKVIRDQQLYPTVFTARLFHNKARIVIDKFNDNFFALIDPNNYFFGFAPRQIVGNQNLQKFPFLSIILYLFGIYSLISKGSDPSKYKGLTLAQRRFIICSLVTSVLSLSLLTVFDRNDFILYFPMFLLTFIGLAHFENKFKNKSGIYYLVFLVFSSIELVRIFL